MREGWRYTAAAGAILLLVGGGGVLFTAGAPRSGVLAGAAIAVVVQVAAFWLLFVWLLPHRIGLAHGLGMLVRFAAVGLVALAWLPRANLPLGPTLFSLVGVLFLTTLVEPLVAKAGPPAIARAGVTA